MNVIACRIPGVLLLEPRVFADERGFFFESFNQRAFREATGLEPRFVQDNHAHSRRHVLRGLHYQVQQAQGKLVRVVAGEVFDVVVDLRPGSPTYGRWDGETLSAANQRQLWIPPGLAHGYLVLSDAADLLYKATAYYAPEHERCIAWDDPTLAIEWPLGDDQPVLSERDRQGSPLPPAGA